MSYAAGEVKAVICAKIKAALLVWVGTGMLAFVKRRRANVCWLSRNSNVRVCENVHRTAAF